jgi:uncharacterized protein
MIRSAAVAGPNDDDATRRLLSDNPWIDAGPAWAAAVSRMPRRSAFERVFNRLHRAMAKPDRAAPLALIGPRRAGKSVLLRQLVARLLELGVEPTGVHLIDASLPALLGRDLDDAAALIARRSGADPAVLLIDQAESRPDWPAALRRLRARFPGAAILAASGLVPADDGAGGVAMLETLTLPPVGFAEYLRLTGTEKTLLEPMAFGGRTMYAVPDAAALDRAFLAWLNSGGFPETVLLPPPSAFDGENASAAARLRSRVTPVMLDEGLAARYGIAAPAELHNLFVRLARNTGGEMSVEELAAACGAAKNTVRRYLDYLEAAGLIRRMPRVHPAGGRFRRMRTFKVHLTAPCLYAGLFGPVDAAHPALPALTETGILAQWQGSRQRDGLHFARLPEGPVDLIGLDPDSLRPSWACALAGRDDSLEGTGIEGLIAFARRNAPLRWLGATTRTKAALRNHGGLEVWHRPAGQYCYEVGRRMAEEAS